VTARCHDRRRNQDQHRPGRTCSQTGQSDRYRWCRAPGRHVAVVLITATRSVSVAQLGWRVPLATPRPDSHEQGFHVPEAVGGVSLSTAHESYIPRRFVALFKGFTPTTVGAVPSAAKGGEMRLESAACREIQRDSCAEGRLTASVEGDVKTNAHRRSR
jgi:hypothetical protein